MDVLALLEAKGLTPIHSSGSEYKVKCINQYAHSDGFDEHESFYINIDKKVAYCQACGYSLSESSFLTWLLGDDIDDMSLQAMILKGTIKRVKVAQEPFLNASEEFTMLPPTKPWTRDYRNISREFYDKLGARHCTVGRYENRIVFPIYVNRRLRGFDSRALGDEKPKYLRSSGFDAVNEGLYPFDLVHDMRPRYVLLCEGIFDAINACYHGFPALCIFGTQFSQMKLSLILSTGAQEIVLMLDNDEAGNKAMDKIIKEFQGWLPISVADNTYIGEFTIGDVTVKRDLGDLTAEQIQYSIDNRRKIK